MCMSQYPNSSLVHDHTPDRASNELCVLFFSEQKTHMTVYPERDLIMDQQNKSTKAQLGESVS